MCMMVEQHERFNVLLQKASWHQQRQQPEGMWQEQTITAAKGRKIVTLLKSDPVLNGRTR